MLSPPVATIRVGIGARPGKVIVHLPSAVAVIVYVTITLSFGPTMDLPSHVPATSESLMPARCAWTAGAGVGGGFWALTAVAPAAKATAERGRMGRIRSSLGDKGR